MLWIVPRASVESFELVEGWEGGEIEVDGLPLSVSCFDRKAWI
jgi:hypothetical protein